MRGLAVAVAFACSGCFYFEGAFECATKDECGASGKCEPCGWCSFPDVTCPSARRYGALSSTRFAGKCVGAVADEAVCMMRDVDLSGGADAGSDFAAKQDGGDLAVADDLAGRDLFGVDLTGVNVGVDGGGPCALPQLLIAVENTDTSFAPGTVLRYYIPPSGPPEACAPLTGKGSLAQHLRAVAFIPPNRIAAAADGWMNLINPDTDDIVQSWSVDNALKPVDVAPIEVAGQAQAAVFYRRSTAALDTLVLYKEGDPSPSPHTATELSATGATGMTIDPFDKTRLWMVTPTVEVLEVDPIAPSSTNYFGGGVDGSYSIAAIKNGSSAHLLWVATVFGGAVYSGPHSMGSMPMMGGPWQCSGCSMLHVVPDPAMVGNNNSFLLCDSTQRSITRITGVVMTPGPTAVCNSLSGVTVGAKDRMSRLAIAMP